MSFDSVMLGRAGLELLRHVVGRCGLFDMGACLAYMLVMLCFAVLLTYIVLIYIHKRVWIASLASSGRVTTFWLVKTCIDQRNIRDGLRVLLVNVMARKKRVSDPVFWPNKTCIDQKSIRDGLHVLHLSVEMVR